MMDLINGTDVCQASEHNDLPSMVLEDIHYALKKLHEAGLVFDDMRPPNIMMVKSRGAYIPDKDKYAGDEWHGQLIDFIGLDLLSKRGTHQR